MMLAAAEIAVPIEVDLETKLLPVDTLSDELLSLLAVAVS